MSCSGVSHHESKGHHAVFSGFMLAQSRNSLVWIQAFNQSSFCSPLKMSKQTEGCTPTPSSSRRECHLPACTESLLKNLTRHSLEQPVKTSPFGVPAVHNVYDLGDPMSSEDLRAADRKQPEASSSCELTKHFPTAVCRRDLIHTPATLIVSQLPCARRMFSEKL